MIPTRKQCLTLFDKYKLSTHKRIHVEEVARLASFFADKLQKKGIKVNKKLVEAAALLHDIDKNITKREGERHPDTAVRILREQGFNEVADVVKKHSVHCILDPALAPQTWEEKVVFLADKMVKYEVIGVDHRFKLWYRENLPQSAVIELQKCYPKVKALKQEVFANADITEIDIQHFMQT